VVTTPARSQGKESADQADGRPVEADGRPVEAASDQNSKPNAALPARRPVRAGLVPTYPKAAEVVERPTLTTEPVSVEKGLAIQHGTPILPARHPNLGLAPFDMKRGFVAAAARVRSEKVTLATRGLEAAVAADPSFRNRHDDVALRRLIRDGSLLVERLAMSLAADDVRWMAEYCEWVVPVYRRKRIPLADLAAIARGISDSLPADLTDEARDSATRTLDAADVVLRRNGRVAGDRHKRRPLLKWLYRGV
jgi:hypothetical protein